MTVSLLSPNVLFILPARKKSLPQRKKREKLVYSFRYKFEAKVPGTHFYHSHLSFQRGDGAFGAFVARQPVEEEPHSKWYDYDLSEHIIFPQEWFHDASIIMVALIKSKVGSKILLSNRPIEEPLCWIIGTLSWSLLTQFWSTARAGTRKMSKCISWSMIMKHYSKWIMSFPESECSTEQTLFTTLLYKESNGKRKRALVSWLSTLISVMGLGSYI